MLDVIEKDGFLLLRVRVCPKSSADAVSGEHCGALRLKVTAAPEKGKANRAARELLARRLGVAKAGMEIVRGAGSRDKVFAVRGIGKDELIKKCSMNNAQ